MPIQKVEWTSPKPYGVGTTRSVHMMGDMVGYEEFIGMGTRCKRGQPLRLLVLQQGCD